MRLIMVMDESDIAAVARARDGDGEAFRLLVERHSRSIFRLAYRVTGSEHDSEDLVQETFMRAFRNLSTFECRSNFRTWLYRIALNCTTDWARKRREHCELNDEVENVAVGPDGISSSDRTSGSDSVICRLDMRRRVQAALQDLSPLERTAFVLRHFEGMSIEEISSTLNVASGAAKHSVFRAVRKMRRALEPLVS